MPGTNLDDSAKPAKDNDLVIPIIGARDYIDQRGFLIHECPHCQRPSIFAVYDTRRKLTLYFIPTLPVRSQQVMECMVCHGRWGIPADERAAVLDQLVSQEEISARMREMYQARLPSPQPFGGQRTLYQVMQVDPLAEPEVIDAAFKRLALKYHPDTSTSPDATARMRELLEAKKILSDPGRRALYDRQLGIIRPIEALRPEDV